MGNLDNKIAIVTGANSGMGMATVEALSDEGATVIMLCRSKKRGEEAFEKLMAKPERKIELMLCDLEDFSSINAFVKSIRDKFEKVDILVNNAGFISLDRQISKEGFEKQFGINHLGHFLLTTQLVELMVEGSRIINVASGAHKVGKIHFDDINLEKGYNVIKAYSQSKLANVLFTRELARRLKDKGITVNCCHPGAVATNIGIDRNTGFGKTITSILKPFFQTPVEGARTAIFLAVDDSVKNISGEYFYKCKIAPSSKRSKDMELARKLYDFSEEMSHGDGVSGPFFGEKD